MPRSRPRSHCAALLLVLGALLAACAPSGEKQLRQTRALMGTMVEISVRGPDPDVLERAVGASFQEMARLSDMMNHYDPASVVSALNNAAGGAPVEVPPELMTVLGMAQAVSRATDGAFDVTVGALRGWRFDRRSPRLATPAEIEAALPQVGYRGLALDPAARTARLARPGMRIDLGGIAKLYILDAGLRVLRERGVRQALVNGGGDVLAMGGTPEAPWRVGVRDPRAPHELLGVVRLERGYVVSSGDYERFFMKDGVRYHHILDPRTGYPTRGPHGVTLVAEDLTAVNGYSAAIMVQGLAAGRARIEGTPGLEGLIVDRDGTLWISEGLRPRLTLGRPLPGDGS